MPQDNSKFTLHANAVNLARRWSAQNENDLMQEDFFEEPEQYSKAQCQNLAAHMLHPSSLPDQCRKYQDVVQYLKRHDSDTSHPTSILG